MKRETVFFTRRYFLVASDIRFYSCGSQLTGGVQPVAIVFNVYSIRNSDLGSRWGALSWTDEKCSVAAVPVVLSPKNTASARPRHFSELAPFWLVPTPV